MTDTPEPIEDPHPTDEEIAQAYQQSEWPSGMRPGTKPKGMSMSEWNRIIRTGAPRRGW